ncbi:MAG: hypothetical protein AAGE94_13680, partial [Acidobacteriota bacterium]
MSRRRALRRRPERRRAIAAPDRSGVGRRSVSAGGPTSLDRARRLGHRWEGRPSPPTLGERVLALADPTVEAGDAFFGRDEDYVYPTLGFTSRVRDHEGPDIDYNAVQGPQGWTATPT